MVPPDLLLLVADTLGMPISEKVVGRYTGRTDRSVMLGPWVYPTEFKAASDVLGASQVSFLVSLGGRVWLYLVVSRTDSTLYVLDPSCLTSFQKDSMILNSKTVEDALSHFAPAIQGQFNYTNREWKNANADTVDKTPGQQDLLHGQSSS